MLAVKLKDQKSKVKDQKANHLASLQQKARLDSQKEEKKLAQRTYEVMYIVDPETPADRVAKLNEAVGKVIEKEGGTVVKMDDMGRRQLAYPIEKKTEGHYVLFEIDGSGQEIAELERRMRVNDMIIRYVTIRVDEDRKKAEKMRLKRENRKAKRSTFRPTEEAADAPVEAAA